MDAAKKQRENLRFCLPEKKSPRTDFSFQVDRIAIIEIIKNVYNKQNQQFYYLFCHFLQASTKFSANSGFEA